MIFGKTVLPLKRMQKLQNSTNINSRLEKEGFYKDDML